uniref:zinc finger MYM-type protein 1-like n=1 Tax=Erigeron canadensis TaxID=72917 RepID=UPI001CB96D9F|nr:zinc finger MYM-type protein 1-like [Erigeron canadensis]
MERYFKRKEPSSSNTDEESLRRNNPNIERPRSTFSTPITVDDMNNLPWDPSERPRILKYNPNQRDKIRRRYWIRGPCQPHGHTFPQTMIGNRARRFVLTWFDKYSNWLEYSVKADKAFCLCCYLFRDDVNNRGGNEAFVTQGFNSWNKTERFNEHIGDINSFHNIALKKFLLNGALPFRGHDESESSFFRGHYLELMKLIASQNELFGDFTLKNAPGNDMLVAPSIQKAMCQSYEKEVLKIIFDEIGDGVFSLLVDESSDVSKKEKMAIVLRYVDRYGFVKESFVGLVHVTDTSSSSLKSAIDKFFS